MLIGNKETCDDGNLINKDGCNDLCMLEDGWLCENECFPICGDGIRKGDEVCDDGNIES